MQLFIGIYSVLFFTFILGLIWPHKASHNFWKSIVGYSLKSLWLSWVILFISFYTSLGTYMPWLIGGLTIIIICQRTFFSYPTSQIIIATNYRYALSLLFILSIVFTYHVVKDYDLVFIMWDSVVSWNRWAIELANNDYNPSGAAYPLFFPGLWSLIYEAQGTTEIWITAKLTVLLIPILLLVIGYFLFLEGRYITSLVFLSTTIFVILKEFRQLTAGWMDYPVAGLILIGLTLLLLVVDDEELNERKKDLLLFSGICLGIASITKQAGILGTIPFLYLILLFLFEKKITIFESIKLILITFLPIILFFIIFKQSGQGITDNLPHLRSLVNENIYLRHFIALKILVKLWMLLFIPALIVNFYYKKEKASQLALLCMGISILGFFIFADCCSYAARNGIWIFMFITCAAMSGVRRWEHNLILNVEKPKILITSKNYSFSFIGFSLAISLMTNFLITNHEIKKLQIEKQWQVGNSEVNKLIQKHQHHLGEQGVVISRYLFIPWLPGFKDKHFKCKTDLCVVSTIKKYPGSLVLNRKRKEGFDYPKFNKNTSINNLLGKAADYELFKTK